MTASLTSLLRDTILATVPRTRSVLLLSSDGIKKAWAGVETDTADQIAAAVSGLHGMSAAVGETCGGNRTVHQMMTEVGEIVLLIMGAAEGSLLAVLADRDVDADMLTYHMVDLRGKIQTHLETPLRQTAALVSSTPEDGRYERR
ncbi:putative regulator of Ras-like GTPase activity (Roadblock/LC7/MglB family) [Saccharomonospora amisosensis]|uniref:Roadblock/LAMTOR2 domain-containing protein n=2 Tax=Saccharomonospora TaxID=1851 RepID=H5X603_9PSEU|nr:MULTISPECIES: roadblock/LC7 domain-containing protein [Saccharomonospora]EHR53402.1 hypothetical protein SacmaDRAFT_5241 [Saccharomonospora marina XMU15]NIJ09854.1 putative regulator of Ras-like GTPase activity (Roadblock/LC7/MglB family) [Saccharomonospora amisosensis]